MSDPSVGGPEQRSPDAGASETPDRRTATVSVVVVLLVVVAVVAAVVGSSSSTHKKATSGGGEEFVAATATDPGASPFTASVVPVADATSPTSTTPTATVDPAAITPAQQVQSGSTPGLYGGTRNLASCDREKMIRFLAANPAKARAWADVEGIAVGDEAAFIRNLTPVVLRSDTRVINHGFRNGAAYPIDEVLQAGTAVLIDDRGVPRARCFCGNPLLAPTDAAPSYRGSFWPGFTPTAVVRITPAPAPITVVVLIDIHTGTTFQRPVHTTGTGDAPYRGPAGGSTTITTTTTTTATSRSGGSTGGGTGSVPGTTGTNYTLTFGTTSFTGTSAGVQTPAICAGFDAYSFKEKLSIDGTSATFDGGDAGVATGTYDPAARTFSVVLHSNVNGNPVDYTTTGTIDADGSIDGTWTSTSPPGDGTCTAPYHAVADASTGSAPTDGVFTLVSATHSWEQGFPPSPVDDQAGTVAEPVGNRGTAHFFWSVPTTLDPRGTTIRWGGSAVPASPDILIHIVVRSDDGITFDTSKLTVDVRGGSASQQAVATVPGHAKQVTLVYVVGQSLTITLTYRR